MVAYSFKEQFAESILLGTKGGTIRADRRRHARPGEELQLYTGMRTQHCRLIMRSTCQDVERITLFFGGEPAIALGARAIYYDKVDHFARFDGFADWPAMERFWRSNHKLPAECEWSGWHIRWRRLPEILTKEQAA